MTERRDLKRRVRARQARTGESYMTARRHVQAQRPTAIPMVEMVDLTELGASLGFKCRIAMFPELAGRVDAAAMLARLRDALLATEGDRALAMMRGVALRGERPRTPISMGAIEEARRFVARVKSGIGGVSEGGRMLAMQIERRSAAGAPEPREPAAGGRALEASPMVLFMLQLMPDFALVAREPTLVITSLDGVTVDPLLAWAGEAP